MKIENRDSSIIIYGIGALITTTLLGWSSRSSWGLAIIEAIILSLLLLSINRIKNGTSKLPIILKLFLVVIFLTTFSSIYYYNSILMLVMYILFIAAFWLITQYVKNEKNIKFIIFMISAVSLIAALNGIINFFRLEDITLGVTSFFGWRNIFAGFILLTLPITLTQFTTANKLSDKLFFGIITILLFSNLYLTFSQAAWISMGIVFVLIVWLLRKLPPKQTISRILIALLFSSILTISLLQLHAPKSEESIQQANVIQTNAINNRLDYWKTSLEMFTHYPWTGVGLGNYETVYTHYQQNAWSFSVSPHNNLLLLLTEVGIFGTIIFLVFMLSVLNKSKYALKKTRESNEIIYYYSIGIVGGIIGFFGHSLVDIDWEIPSLLLLWFIEVGLIFAISNQYNKKNSNEISKDIKRTTNTQISILVFALIFGYLIVVPTITDLWNTEVDIIQDDSGDIDASIVLLNKALKLNPLDSDLFSNLSESYQIKVLDHVGTREDNQEKMISSAEKAMELDSLSYQRHEALGYAYNFISSGEDDEIIKAEKELLKTIKYNPYNNIYQYQLLSFILQRQGKYQQALDILDNAIAIFDLDSINKIHADQETHNNLILQKEGIENLRSRIEAQMQ